MNDQPHLERSWARAGAAAGCCAAVLYPIMLLVPLPASLAALAGCCFGLALALASVGLCVILQLHRRSIVPQIAAGANTAAGLTVSLMLLAQLSLNHTVLDLIAGFEDPQSREILQTTWQAIDRVQLGFDVVWDFFLVVGTLLFAIAMRRHPRFGPVFSASGLVVAIGLGVLNFASFPIPPAQSGLVDLGPAVGFWYLIVAVQVLRSLRWVDLQHPQSPPTAT